MQRFGIQKDENKGRAKTWNKISMPFLLVLLLCFIFFSFFSRITNMFLDPQKVDVFGENIEHLAFSFRPIDKNVSQLLLSTNQIIHAYMSGENVLITKAKEIDEVMTYIQRNKEYLKKIGFQNYEPIINLIADLQKHKDELFDLLGQKKSQNYLVILQNTNEKRPNGGFFGSFAFIKIEAARIKTLEIVDSYYPDFIAYQTRILAPDRTIPFLPDRKIGFIAGNKFGFSDIDGKNLKDLYELMFNKTYDIGKVKQTMQPELYEKLLHQDIRGVIFVRSDMFERLLPGFKNKVRERQFLNAAVDLIRKEYRGNKKELYIKEVKQYINDNRLLIVQNFINRFDEIANHQYITMYFSSISPQFDGLLAKNKLSNVFDPRYIYFRDTNASYNKIDGFVQKSITVHDSDGIELRATDRDLISTDILQTGKAYTISISYKLDVPTGYQDQMKELEEKYDVLLSGRENAILGLIPGNYNELGFGLVKKRWETKASIYFPPNIHILNVTGDLYYSTAFYPPFANGLFYQMGSIENNTTRTVKIQIQVK